MFYFARYGAAHVKGIMPKSRALPFSSVQFMYFPYNMNFCKTLLDTLKHFVLSLGTIEKIISIFHGCMVWIEKSVTRVTDRHHEACRVMPNSDPMRQIFLSITYTHDRYFFLHTF